MRKFLLLSIGCLSILCVFAQEVSQQLTGKIIDKISKKPVSGAVIILKQKDTELTATSDSTGYYQIKNIQPGAYSISVVLVGYSPFSQDELVVYSGKQKTVDVELSESPLYIKEVEIRDERKSIDNLSSLNERSFTVEQTQRFASALFDPARMVTAVPGVVSSQDFGNDVVIRGNSPAGVLWKIEGSDVVNPNHLPNGGTPGERVSASGGGYSILSGQVFADSRLMLGSYGAGYGNALAGIFDIKLRKGNISKREYILQASLIGLDAAAEGPFKKGGKASYLINARYSTTGLLGLVGVTFGGQLFAFQDISLNFNLPTKRLGTFSVFAFGGSSLNTYSVEKDTALWKTQADRTQIRFNSMMGAVGGTHSLSFGKNVSLFTSAAISGTENSNHYSFINNDFGAVTRFKDVYNFSLFSVSPTLSIKSMPRNTTDIGVIYQQRFTRLDSKTALSLNPYQADSFSVKGNTGLVQSFIRNTYKLSSFLAWEAGVHSSFLILNNKYTLEPRTSLKYAVNKRFTVSAAYGLVSQMPSLTAYFLENNQGQQINKNIDFTKAHHFVVGQAYRFESGIKLRTEIYYQYIYNVPVSNAQNGTFSMLNYFEGFVGDSLVNKGTGTNRGIDVSVEKSLKDGYYFIASSSLYDSKYKGLDGVERNTRFNGNYSFHVAAGRELPWNKNGKNRTVGLNIRLFYNGGFRETPINLAASETTGTTVYDYTRAFGNKLPDYYRADIRLSIRKNKPGYTRTLSLDIQNVTNAQNIAIRFYDPESKQIESKFQLGLIPVLAYRVEF